MITGAGDDSLDWTDGWTGNVQYAIVVQSAGRGDRGIEADNRNGSNDDMPRSNPTISNFTFVGGAAGDTGMVLRRGTGGLYANGILTNWQDAAIDVDDAATAALLGTGLNFESLFTANNNELIETGNEVDTNNDDVNDAPDGFAPATTTEFNESSVDAGSVAATTVLQAGADDTGITTPLVPGTGPAGVTAADPTGFNSFFGPGSYVGAVENDADNWYVGWTFAL